MAGLILGNMGKTGLLSVILSSLLEYTAVSYCLQLLLLSGFGDSSRRQFLRDTRTSRYENTKCGEELHRTEEAIPLLQG